MAKSGKKDVSTLKENIAKQIVFNRRSSQMLEELKTTTGLNNSQAVATALHIAKLVIDAQNKGMKVVIEDEKKDTRTNVLVCA